MSDSTALSVPPAGWYPDRGEADLLRWWDGQQWTDQTQSTAPAAAAFEEPVSVAAFGLAQHEQSHVAQAAMIPPGWYPDNANPSLQRWWDGTQWTTHTAAASPVLQQNGAGLYTASPYAVGPQPVSSGGNNIATLSLLFSVLSIGGLFLVWLLPLSIVGIILGIIGVRRAGRFAAGVRKRGQAIAGIIVGVISLAMTILLTVAALATYQQIHNTGVTNAGTQQSSPQTGGGPTADPDGIFFPSTVDELKQQIAKSATRDFSMAVTNVTCDSAASMVSGSTFDCGVAVADGRWAPIRVNITKPAGTGMGYGFGHGPLLAAHATPSPHPYTLDQIKQELTVNLAQAWESAVSTFTCDPSASTTLGSTFGCRLDLADGRTADVLITMTPVDGYDLSVIHAPAGTGAPAGTDGSDSGDSSDPDVSHT